jgi:MraZ protein
MVSFVGDIEAKVDGKGRLFIPAQFRRQLQLLSEGERLVMRKESDKDCLSLYPESVWNEDLNMLCSRLNKWNPQHRQVLRQYVSEVEILEPDANGRILIPRRYLQRCSMESDVRVLGVKDRIELWPKAKAEEPFMQPDEFARVLQEIMQGHSESETIALKIDE